MVTRKTFLPRLLLAQIVWFGVIASPNVAAGQPDSIARTIAQLRELKGDTYTPLPAAVRPLLTRLKHQLRDLILATLNTSEVRQPTSLHLRTTILARLTRAGVQLEELKDEAVDSNYLEQEYVYGDIYRFSVLRPAQHPDLIAVTMTIGICCGEDTSFYLLKRRGAQWRLALAQETNDYAEINGAQAWFHYALSPPDRRGNFFVVTANVNPWCTSNWQGLRYQVMRLGPSAEQPRIILKREASIYLGIAPPVYRLKVAANGLRLKFYTEADAKTLNRGATTQRAVVRYIIAGNHAKRIPSAARARIK